MAQDGRRVNTYDYRPNTSTEYQRFSNDYFAGSDIRIYFGDVWVDEITSLQFTLQEQVTPIYGYASYTWDKVARGTRHIQGNFSINFKESYYLHYVMNSLSSKMQAPSTSSPAFSAATWKEGVSVEHLVESADGPTFESVADEFEKSLWGEGSNANINSVVATRKGNTFFSPEQRGKNEEDGSATYDQATSQKQLAEQGFNILVGYGPMNEKDGMKAAETAHTLMGVQITGVSQVIGGDGQPIQEMYSFIARDLDGDVSVPGSSRTNYGGPGGPQQIL